MARSPGTLRSRWRTPLASFPGAPVVGVAARRRAARRPPVRPRPARGGLARRAARGAARARAGARGRPALPPLRVAVDGLVHAARAHRLRDPVLRLAPAARA